MQRVARTWNLRQAERTFAEGRLGCVNRRQRACLRLALVLALTCVPAGRSQSSQVPGWNHGTQEPVRPDKPIQAGVDTPDDDRRTTSIMTQSQLRELNQERQKQMVADANKLLKLATELNDEISAANRGTLTPDQLRKIAKIEKLARSVKERMTIGAGQPGLLAPQPVYTTP